ncbi:MAG: fumarylacetoacetate hydrolase family protein [Ilumatobacteraceae bacterium]
MSLVGECADIVQGAVQARTAMGRLTERFPELDLAAAYDVQDEITDRRVAAGEVVIGAKLGLTSRAKQVQMNCTEPMYGMLFSGSVHPAGDPIVVDSLIHPRVEPEIVFVMGDSLAGPGVTAADVLAAVKHVGCGLEIIDSRYADFSFTAADVVADNTSEARFVLGPTMIPPDGIDLSLVGLLLEVDGVQVATASGAATMGHPAEAVAMLANHLGARGKRIEAGWVILTGGLTAAVPLNPGTHVTATYGHLGQVTVRGV